jgi:hypothetical protein
MVSGETHTLQSQERAIAVTQPSIGRRCLPPIGTSAWTQRWLADINLIHRQHISLKQPTDHLGCRHGFRLVAPVGHGLFGSALIRALTPDELACLPQGGPPLRTNVCWFVVALVRRGRRKDQITVVGHAAMISAGEFVQMSGAWVNNRTHGQQFRASFLKVSPPTILEGIERYLASGMIRGIGPVYAKRLVRGFGEAVFDLIEQQPERLREVTGIGAKRAARIVAGWAEQKVITGDHAVPARQRRRYVAGRADL